MQVVVTGAQEVRAKLAVLPGQLRQGVQAATPRAIELQASAIRSATPRLTGSLANSIQVSVTNSADGAKGKVQTDLRYAPYVEHGTQRHGPGRHMFERGAAQTRGQVEDLYEAAVDQVAANF